MEIFVAYSGERGRKRRDTLRTLLESHLPEKAPGVTIRVTGDHCLQPRDQWHSKLNDLLDSAHGAVLILTRDTLISGYQHFEASVLTHRHHKDPRDLGLVAVLDGVSVEDLQSHGLFKWLELDRYQQITITDEGWGDRVADAFVDLAKKRQIPPTPMARRANRIKQRLERLRDAREINEATLRSTAKHNLHVTDIERGSLGDACARIAQELVNADSASYCCNALNQFRRENAIGSDEALLFFLNVLAPGWVPQENAQLLHQTLLGERGRRFIALATAHQLIVQLHLALAFEQDFDKRCKEIPLNRPIGEDRVAETKAVLLDRFCPDCRKDDELNRRLAIREQHREPVVLLCQEAPSEQYIRDMGSVLPVVTLFFMTGASPLPTPVKSLAALDSIKEEEICDNFQFAKEQFGRPEAGPRCNADLRRP